MRACKSPTDWTLLALQSERSGKAHYVVVCKCPTHAQLEGPYTHNHPPYANIPGESLGLGPNTCSLSAQSLVLVADLKIASSVQFSPHKITSNANARPKHRHSSLRDAVRQSDGEIFVASE